jgi:hypothetical protein
MVKIGYPDRVHMSFFLIWDCLTPKTAQKNVSERHVFHDVSQTVTVPTIIRVWDKNVPLNGDL